MKGGANQEPRELAIVEAVETLSEIADLDFEGEIGVSLDHEFVLLNRPLKYQTVHWLSGKDRIGTMKAVKQTFRVVLNYLRHFYKSRRGGEKRAFEGIKNIMVLVGEAAAKLDRLSGVFEEKRGGSVTNLREFKQLKNFYQSKIARKEGGEQGLWERVFAPIAEGAKERVAPVVKDDYSKAFQDLEVIKKDVEYELFFMRKPNGKRFYHPRLMRNMKVVCDFSKNFGLKASDDPLIGIAIWQDHAYQIAASNIVSRSHQLLDVYFSEAMKFRERESISLLNKAVMALFLCANPRNLLRNSPVKSSTAYFTDFQNYLRQLLASNDYQRFSLNSGRSSGKIDSFMVELTQQLCSILMTANQSHYSYNAIVQLIVLQGLHELKLEIKEDEPMSHYLNKSFEAVKEVIKRHPNGPLLQNLILMESGKLQSFDSLIQGNLPHQLFNLFTDKNKIGHLRLPSPTSQEQIDKASVTQEYLAALAVSRMDDEKPAHLLINLQDRTSWRQHARSVALENLSQDKELGNAIEVLSLNRDIDFYEQLGVYIEIAQSDVFLQQFAEHLRSPGAGYFFGQRLQKMLEGDYLERLFKTILNFFFEGKNVLKREDRLNFIEIAYCFIELKALDTIQPQTFSLTCKDCVDLGPVASSELFILIHLFNQQPLTPSEKAFFNLMLFAPALILRQRLLQWTPFKRMLALIAHVENVIRDMGQERFKENLKAAFQPLFESSIFQADISLPKLLQEY